MRIFSCLTTSIAGLASETIQQRKGILKGIKIGLVGYPLFVIAIIHSKSIYFFINI